MDKLRETDIISRIVHYLLRTSFSNYYLNLYFSNPRIISKDLIVDIDLIDKNAPTFKYGLELLDNLGLLEDFSEWFSSGVIQNEDVAEKAVGLRSIENSLSLYFIDNMDKFAPLAKTVVEDINETLGIKMELKEIDWSTSFLSSHKIELFIKAQDNITKEEACKIEAKLLPILTYKYKGERSEASFYKNLAIVQNGKKVLLLGICLESSELGNIRKKQRGGK